MTQPTTPVQITLRIPGRWAHPGELIERLPAGYQLTPEALILPDETRIEFVPMPADTQFAKIFRSSCRQAATDDELKTVDSYSVNVGMNGPGGSLESARTMMRAAAAVVRAGGAGVFIDNSGLAHGGQAWLDMTDDGSPDALSFAFVSIVRGQSDVWTMGMHILGFRDLVVKRSDAETDGFDIIDVIRYVSGGEKPIGDGHIIADLDGPRFQVFSEAGDKRLAGSPMENPFGRWRLVSMADAAERN